MKKLAIGVLITLTLLVGAVLVGPSLIDWNSHTDRIARQIEKLTGRRVIITGSIDVQVLPSPILSVSGVKLANIAGSSEPHMASLESLEVRIAAAPLLAGRVQVETIKLVRPVLHLERLTDDRVNWNFDSVEGASKGKLKVSGNPLPTSTTTPRAAPGAASIASAVAIDNLTVEDGQIIYRDAQRELTEVVSDIDGSVAVVSLNGPIESTGSITVRGRRIGYRLNVAEIIHGRTVPLTLGINLGDDTAFKIDGSIVNLSDTPRLKAKISGGGGNLGQVVEFLAGPSGRPVNIAKPFAVDGTVEIDRDSGKLEMLKVKLDETAFTVGGSFTAGDVPVVSLSVKSGWIDLDKWLVTLAKINQPKTPTTERAAAGQTKNPGNVKPVAKAKAAPASADMLPRDIQASMSVNVDSLVFRGKPIQNIAVDAELVNGELTLSQFTAQLPGDVDVGVFGFLAAQNRELRFEGEIESRSPDLAPAISWLAPSVALGRRGIRNFSFKTPLVIDRNYAQLTGIKAGAGDSHLTGGITIAMQKRPSFGANLVIDKLDVDSWLGASKTPKRDDGPSNKPSEPEGSLPGAASGKKTGNSQAGAGLNPLAPLKALAAFDANIKLVVGQAKYSGKTVRKIDLDATLQQGDLSIKHLKIGYLAGVAGKVSGGLSALGSIPSAKKLEIVAEAKTLATFAKTFGLTLPLPAKDLGAVSLRIGANGGLLAPDLDVRARALEGEFAASGKLPVLALVGKDVNLAVSAKHGNLRSLLKRLGIDYEPQGKIGGFDLRGKLTGDLKSMRLSNFTGQFGGIKTTGKIELGLNGPRPSIGAALALGPFNADNFLPARRSASLAPGGWRIDRAPVAWLGPIKGGLAQQAAISRRWSSKGMLDLSVLSAVDAAINMTTPRMTLQGIAYENVDLKAVMQNGSVTVDQLNARLLGGTVNAKAQIDRNAQISARGSFAGLDLARARGLTGDAKAAGRIDGDFDLAARGLNEAAIVSSLSGTLNFTGKDLNSAALSDPETGFGLGGLFLALNQFGGSLGGPKKGGGVADVEAKFRVHNGVATPLVLSAVTNVGVATTDPKSNVDLAAWTANLSGAIKASPSLLSAAVSIATRKGINVPFSVTGNLDKPRIRVDTSSLGTGGVPIPGLDRVLGNKGVGGIIQGILGGGQPSSTSKQAPSSQDVPVSSGSEPPPQGSAPPSQQPAPQTQSAPKKVNPVDILRGILNR